MASSSIIVAAICVASLTLGETRIQDPAKKSSPPAERTTYVEPGTPAIYLTPYLPQYTPIAIYRDGRQVYDDLPTTVPQEDGTALIVPTRVEIEPATPAPVLPSEVSPQRR